MKQHPRTTSSLSSLGGVALLTLASLLPVAVPAWFAAPPAQVNFLGSGAPLLLAVGVVLRWRWAWRIAGVVALLGLCTSLLYATQIAPRAYIGGWLLLATLTAAALWTFVRRAPGWARTAPRAE